MLTLEPAGAVSGVTEMPLLNVKSIGASGVSGSASSGAPLLSGSALLTGPPVVVTTSVRPEPAARAGVVPVRLVPVDAIFTSLSATPPTVTVVAFAVVAKPTPLKSAEVRALMEKANVPQSVAEKWVEARAADDEPGSTVRRPLHAAGDVVVSDAEVTVRTVRGIRVTSARRNLIGQRELAWVADEGEPVGDAHCSQNVRLSPDVPAAVRPSLLLCWRTSATKSVYTVQVDRRNSPSKQRSVALISKAWASIG
jgi:hypothetical protein